MAQSYKLLGRDKPAAATPVTLYTAPVATQALLVTLIACDTNAGQDDSIDVWIVPSGGAAADNNSIIRHLTIDFGDPYMMNAPVILETGDFIVVQSSGGNVTFTASGMLIT